LSFGLGFAYKGAASIDVGAIERNAEIAKLARYELNFSR
jgi:hypothetical protein